MSGDFLELVATWDGIANGMNGKSGAEVERRQRVRVRLRWPVLLFRDRTGSEAIETVTRDVSSGGFYCLTKVQLMEGEQLVCSIKIPTHDPQGKQLEHTLECMVTVVRVDEISGLYGIACQILDYHLSHPHSAPEM